MYRPLKVYILIALTLVIVEGSYFYNLYAQKKYYTKQVYYRLNKVMKILNHHQSEITNHWKKDLKSISEASEFLKYIRLFNDNEIENATASKKEAALETLEKIMLKYAVDDAYNKFIKFVNADGGSIVTISGGQVIENNVNNDYDLWQQISNIEDEYRFIYEVAENNFCLGFAVPIYFENKKIGALISVNDYKGILSLFDKIVINGLIDNVFIVDGQGNLLYTNNYDSLMKNVFGYKNNISLKLLKGGQNDFKNNILYVKNTPSFDAKIILATYNTTFKEYVYKLAGEGFAVYIFVGLCILLFFFWIIHIITIEFNRSIKKVTNSENYLKAVLHMMGNLLFIIDAETLKIEHINQAVFITLEYDDNDLLGKKLDSVFDREKSSVSNVQSFLESKVVNNLEIYLKTKSNLNIPVLFSSSIIEERGEKIQRKLICVAINIAQQKKVQDELHFIAHHDSLTKLSNRLTYDELMQKEIARSLRANMHFAIFCIDINDFKNINNELGFDIGDLLLQQFAKRIKTSIRKEDLTFRLGEDLFSVVIVNVKESKDVSSIAKHLIESLPKSFDLHEYQVTISINMGIAIYPTSGSNSRNLHQKAIEALNEAKKAGKNLYRFA